MILAIYGTHGTGKELFELATRLNRWDDIVFINDFEEEGEFCGKQKMTYDSIKEKFSSEQVKFIIAMGEPLYKKLIYDKLKKDGYSLETIICPDVTISPTTKVGEGVIIKNGSIISSDCIIEDNVFIQSYAVIGHDVCLGKHTQVSTFSLIAGNVKIGEGTYVGVHSAIREGLTVGHDSIVSMGAIVLKDVEPEMVVMGNPARSVKKNEDKKVFK